MGILKTLYVTLPLLAGLTLWQQVAFADNVTLTFTGVNPDGTNLGGVYTSPYQFQIGTSSTTVYLVCDDFTTDINVGDSWTAAVTPLSSLAGTPGATDISSTSDAALKFQSATVQQYEEAAYLAQEILALPYDPNTAPILSYALWEIFDPSAENGYNGTNYIGAAAQAAVVIDQNQAIAAVTAAGYTPPSNVFIYTPTPNASVSQEFIGVVAPEWTGAVILAFDLLALSGILLVLRRRRIISSESR